MVTTCCSAHYAAEYALHLGPMHAQRGGAPEFSGEMIGWVLRGFSVGSHGYSWVLMGSQWVLMGSHGFSVGTQTVHFWVLRRFSGRHPSSVPTWILDLV